MNRIRAALLGLLLSAFASSALAQSSPGFIYGQVPTVAQWNALFAGKQDVLAAPPLLTSGGTMTGPLVTAASTTSVAGLNVPAGTAPTAPFNGDIWVTTAGMFVQINGVAIGPLGGASSSSFAATAPITVSFPSGVTTYALSINSTLAVAGGNLGINLANANTYSATQTFPNNSLTLAEFPTIGANTVIGSIAGGTPAALSKLQLTTLVNPFTASLSGAVNAPVTAVGNFLRDDNTWQAAGGTGTVTGPVSSTTNAIPRWSNTGGIVLLNSGVTIDGSNNVNVPGAFAAGTGISTGANTVIGYAGASPSRADFMNFGGTGSLGNAQASTWDLRRNFDNVNMFVVDGNGNASAAGAIAAAAGFVSNQAVHTVPINENTSAFNNVGPGAVGTALMGGGASADPSFVGGMWKLINTLNGAGGTSVSDTTSITSSYTQYRLVFTQIVPSANGASPQLQIHSGGAFKATGYLNNGSGSGTTTVGLLSSPSTTFVQLGFNSAVDTANNPKNASPGLNGEVRMFNPSASQITTLRSDMGYLNGAGGVLDLHATGFWNTSGAIDGFSFGFGGTTTFTGTLEIYGAL